MRTRLFRPHPDCRDAIGVWIFLQESLRLSKGGRKGEDERAIDDRTYSDTFSKEKADESDMLRDAQRDELATASVMILPLAKVMSACGTFSKLII